MPRMTCPECGSRRVRIYRKTRHAGMVAKYWRCRNCKAEWQTDEEKGDSGG